MTPKLTPKFRIAVLASGSGSNLQAILEAIDSGDLEDGRVALVVSDKKNAFALERARQRTIPTIFFNPRNYLSREDMDRDIVETLNKNQIDLVVLAGYMRLLTPLFINAFKDRILNIHPALLPSFPGEQGVVDALKYGVKVSGCTIHFVDEGVDTGPIIMQEAVPVYTNDTEETLHQRIQVLEHKLYPRVINLFLKGKIKIQGRRCIVDEK
ncbi:MAG: Phosphoribosylglycinamide formyltransferase [candidate division WS2 bacterium]|uniref:Phosphoribosylglycinamide formyltransferase n=1 Tax=Psychracetigena formicireducens TaxID=2986056 RepID=A0A9E2BIX2_PSYF1|nr:Phosphoribosylglycinamide formyltransferase [Candidatus Psychracetigena formicireducens]MBT9145521.1 Phosphoribosylglycinamide formyltransferase [Candidatus Psychracetigena formicireducens]